MQLPRFNLDTADADKTTEYRGRVQPVEVVTDVTMELLPDDTGQPSPLQARIAAAIASFPPPAISSANSSSPQPPPSPQSMARPSHPSHPSPDASLEFPHPVSPELFADGTGELRAMQLGNDYGDSGNANYDSNYNSNYNADFDDELEVAPRTRREPPRWRLYAFAATMIVSATLVGFAFAARSHVTTVEEPSAATKPTVIETRKLQLPAPDETGATATQETTKAQTTGNPLAGVTASAPTTATATTATAANIAKEKVTTGFLVTPQWAKGRNVWVDGVVFGVSPKVEAACGKHTVKVGDKGKARTVNIPCGGKVVVAP